MFKKFYGFVAIILIFTVFFIYAGPSAKSISDKLIRFHVIANSDSLEDQDLKLKVRDKVLRDIGPKLDLSGSKEESRDILNENLDVIKKAAEEEIKRNNKDYPVAVVLGKSTFPTKMYSNIALPAGEYDALKIIIGSGEGKNWWCVMFPPLCFIDITKGITSGETEDRLKTVLSDGEFDTILNNAYGDNNKTAVKKPIIEDFDEARVSHEKSGQKIEMRFKTVEVLESMFTKIENVFGSKK